MRRLFICLTLLITALLAPVLPPAARPVTAQTPPVAPAAIDCAASPFGSTLTLGREDELFLGYRDVGVGGGPAGGLGVYRLDKSPTSVGAAEAALVSDTANGRSQISDLAATAADLNGDGSTEAIQTFSDATGRSQLFVLRPGGAPAEFIDGSQGHTMRAVAAGDILGVGGLTQQAVVASRDAAGGLNIQVYQGAADGSIAGRAAWWRSTAAGRAQPVLIRVDTGNLDGDRYDDIIVSIIQSDRATVQLLYLERQQGAQGDGAGTTADGLSLRASATSRISGVAHMALTLADTNGDNSDEIVLGTAEGSASAISAWIYRFNPVTTALDYRARGLFPVSANGFTMASGDVDGPAGGVRRDEIVLAYQSNGANNYGNGLHIQVARLSGLDSTSPQLTTDAYYADDHSAANLALAVADLDKDNRAEVVAAYSDGEPFGMRLLTLGYSAAPARLLQRSSLRLDATLGAAPALAVGDWDDNSLRAVAQPTCRQLTENQILGAVFVPPFWQNIQGEVSKQGTLGSSLSREQVVEKSFSYIQGGSSSVYVGVSAGISLFDLVELSASVRATASHEYSTSASQGTSTSQATIRTRGIFVDNDGVAFTRSNYRCYTYALEDGGVPIAPQDAGVRLCEFLPQRDSAGRITEASLISGSLDSWDSNYSDSQAEWVPVARDWANLALFRGPYATQSSEAGGAGAGLALDSEIARTGAASSYLGGGVARTASEAGAWWQVDLGASEPIARVRLFTPPASLGNFVVLVAEQDFRTMPEQGDPDALAARPDVHAFSVGGPAGATTVVKTLVTAAGGTTQQPVSGRYVRVQRRGVAALALAEVQVLGPNHVEPDRYPLGLCDARAGAPAGSTTYNGDGFFGVRLHNPWAATNNERYPCVKVRGQLRWGGPNDQPGVYAVTRNAGGNGTWSLSTSTGGSTFTGSSFEATSSVGVELDAEGGVLAKVQAGGARTSTTGIAQESTLTTSWTSSFDVGGSVGNFPDTYTGPRQAWADSCQYTFEPYFYEVADESSSGFQQRYTVLDYLVPFSVDDPATLNREDAAPLANCRNGNQTAGATTPADDQAAAYSGQPRQIAVLANDSGNGLRLVEVGQPRHGAVTFTARSITYTPGAGYAGEDSFTYTAEDAQGQRTRGSVRVTVSAVRPIYLPLVAR